MLYLLLENLIIWLVVFGVCMFAGWQLRPHHESIRDVFRLKEKEES